MKDESGVDAGIRSIGHLALSFIPYALGMGAMVWFGMWVGVERYKAEQSQERRAAAYVAAEEKPKEKLKITVVSRDCAKVIRADVSSRGLFIYSRNDCDAPLRYLEYHWQLISPNGTVIKQDYTNLCPIPTQPKDSAECKMTVSNYDYENDDRAVILRVWVKSSLV